MEREFREAEAFTRLVKSKTLTDEQLRQLQRDIISGLGKTMPRAGGLKKIRLEGSGIGKRGAWRVIYADYPDYGFTVIVFAYPKGVKDTLSRDEECRFSKLKATLDDEVKRKYGKNKKR